MIPNGKVVSRLTVGQELGHNLGLDRPTGHTQGSFCASRIESTANVSLLVQTKNAQ